VLGKKLWVKNADNSCKSKSSVIIVINIILVGIGGLATGTGTRMGKEKNKYLIFNQKMVMCVKIALKFDWLLKKNKPIIMRLLIYPNTYLAFNNHSDRNHSLRPET